MTSSTRSFLVSASLALAFVSSIIAPASAAPNNQKQVLCGAYAKMGGAVADFILPLTFGQMLDMQHGRNMELAAQLPQKLINSLTGEEMMAMGKLKGDSRSNFMDSANQMTFNLLQSGKARNTAEVTAQLAEHCKTNLIAD